MTKPVEYVVVNAIQLDKDVTDLLTDVLKAYLLSKMKVHKNRSSIE